jgi:hypothetical protein
MAKLIKITAPVTYGYRNGARIVAKTSADEPFSEDAAKADRLVRLGLAEYVEDKTAEPAVDAKPAKKGKKAEDEPGEDGDL